MKILLIEDGRIEQRLFTRALEKEFPGIAITVVPSVAGARRHLREGLFDIVFADYYLEDGTADELFPFITDLPFIIITASEDQDVAVRALRAGAFDFIVKSPNLDYLQHVPIAAQRAWEYQNTRKLLGILSSAMTNTADAVLVTDTDEEVIYANRSATLLFERSQDEFLGRRLLQVPGADRIAEILSERERFTTKEILQESLLISGRSRKEIPVEVKLVPIQSRRGELEYFVIILRDLRLEKKNERARAALEERLAISQRYEAFGTISGTVAHDFNNILASVLGYLELCLDDVPAQSILHRNLLEIQKASNRARLLVEQILSAGKGETPERLLLPLQMTIQEVVELVRVRLGPNITAEYNLPRDMMIVEADPAELHQIILNLCTNARDTLRRKGGGALHVALSRITRASLPIEVSSALRIQPKNEQAEVAVIEITDTGEGIPEENLERIFDPFFSTGSEEKHSGLGMPTVRRIARSLGGTLQIQSVVGEGTTVRVYLPLIELQSSGVLGSGSMKRPERILVIDDEEPILGLMRQLLERLGYITDTCLSSAEAFTKILGNSFDLVITDLVMPELSGEELIRGLRSAGISVPVIICSSLYERISEELQRELLVSAVISKPVNIPELALLIRDALDVRTREKRAPGQQEIC